MTVIFIFCVMAVQVVKHTSTMPSLHFLLSAASHHRPRYTLSSHFQSLRATASSSSRLDCLKREAPDRSDQTSTCDKLTKCVVEHRSQCLLSFAAGIGSKLRDVMSWHNGLALILHLRTLAVLVLPWPVYC